MLILSERLDVLAPGAIVEAMRLDNQKAPRPEKERLGQEGAETPDHTFR
jgi:hypothetical protein